MFDFSKLHFVFRKPASNYFESDWVKVRLIKEWKGISAGNYVIVHGDIANILIKEKIAENNDFGFLF